MRWRLGSLCVGVWSGLDRHGVHLPLVRAEPADVGHDLVQAVTGDVLHGVVADAVVLAVVEDRDDIGVVQLGRRAGFVMEPPEVVGSGAEPWVHDLERDVAAERYLACLIRFPTGRKRTCIRCKMQLQVMPL